jgi:pyruvate kinase
VLKKGDIAVFVAGLPLSRKGTTNMIRVETVG